MLWQCLLEYHEKQWQLDLKSHFNLCCRRIIRGNKVDLEQDQHLQLSTWRNVIKSRNSGQTRIWRLQWRQWLMRTLLSYAHPIYNVDPSWWIQQLVFCEHILHQGKIIKQFILTFAVGLPYGRTVCKNLWNHWAMWFVQCILLPFVNSYATCNVPYFSSCLPIPSLATSLKKLVDLPSSTADSNGLA